MKENAKIVKTKNSLRASLIDLAERKSINDVTVTELCEAAKINRSTFYKYYSVPIDVISEFGDEVVEGILYAIQNGQGLADSKNSINEICRLYYENRDILRYYKVTRISDSPKMNDYLKLSKDPLSSFRGAKMTFVSGGISSIMLRWAESDFEKSPDEIAKLINVFNDAVNAIDDKKDAF